MRLNREELLALHRELVATPSVSGDEVAIVSLLSSFLQDHGATSELVGGSLVAWAGKAPVKGDVESTALVVLNSHVDTVPPAPGWTREPHQPSRADGRVFGLGANDAKASVAAMTAAFLAVAELDLPFALALMLVRGEETKSVGTAEVVAEFSRRRLVPTMAVVGEPTGLDLAVAQKGLLVLELVARGEAAHAAHARALGARNAIVGLARDLTAIAGLPEGPLDPYLGRATVEPTVVSGGSARNVVPAEARAVLDCRTVRDDYDPRRASAGKRYRYLVLASAMRDPLLRDRAWHVWGEMDLDRMRREARHLPGTHDFAAFRAADCERETTRRHLFSVDVKQGYAGNPELVAIEVVGSVAGAVAPSAFGAVVGAVGPAQAGRIRLASTLTWSSARTFFIRYLLDGKLVARV